MSNFMPYTIPQELDRFASIAGSRLNHNAAGTGEQNAV
jgi:hypothetical protein